MSSYQKKNYCLNGKKLLITIMQKITFWREFLNLKPCGYSIILEIVNFARFYFGNNFIRNLKKNNL